MIAVYGIVGVIKPSLDKIFKTTLINDLVNQSYMKDKANPLDPIFTFAD
jgi:hypothetical protein